MGRNRRSPGSATFRLTLLAVPLYLLAGWALLAFVYVNTRSIMEGRVDHGITAERQRLLEDLGRLGRDRIADAVSARVVAERGSARLYRLEDRGGIALAANFEAEPERLPAARAFVDATVWRLPSGAGVQARLFRMALPAGLTLVLGRDLTEESEFRRVIEETLAIAVVLTVVLATAAGIATSRWVVHRLAGVNRTAGRILGGHLDERVPADGSGDEFDHLAGNLNSMLDRIVELMQATRQVTDNIAHDLRSPLSRMRNRLELALIPGPDRDSVDEVLQACLDDTDRVLETFEALLTIARVTNGIAPEPQRVELQPLAEDLVDYFQPLAEEKGLTLTLAEAQPLAVAADPHLLFQALSNIADNAVRYTPEGGTIEVAVRRAGSEAVVTIADNGPGIPADRRADVLKRFVRLDASRHLPGSGLGLSVVEAVARHHHARLTLDDNGPGLRVSLAMTVLDAPCF